MREIAVTMVRHADTVMLKQSILKRLMQDQSGASAMEYGLIIAMVSMTIIGALQGLSGGLGAVWDTATTKIVVASRYKETDVYHITNNGVTIDISPKKNIKRQDPQKRCRNQKKFCALTERLPHPAGPSYGEGAETQKCGEAIFNKDDLRHVLWTETLPREPQKYKVP